jgi:hypothetical protein
LLSSPAREHGQSLGTEAGSSCIEQLDVTKSDAALLAAIDFVCVYVGGLAGMPVTSFAD